MEVDVLTQISLFKELFSDLHFEKKKMINFAVVN